MALMLFWVWQPRGVKGWAACVRSFVAFASRDVTLGVENNVGCFELWGQVVQKTQDGSNGE